MSSSAKPVGWFSRRHQTSAARDEYREEMAAREADFWARHDERVAARKSRSPQQQLAELDARLGKGVGAKKERKRLQAQIDNAKHRAKKTDK